MLPNLLTGADEAVYANVVAFRLKVPNAAALRQLLPILYCEEQPGKPIEECCTPSPYYVYEIASGSSDWSPQEVAEFVDWLDSNEPLNRWLDSNYAVIHEAIIAHPIWQSQFVLGD